MIFPTPTGDASGKLPLHVQISEMLAREIQAGILPDGTKLKPERELAQDLGIAVGTLRKALSDLTDKGLLERVQGSGNYVRNNAQAKTIYSFFHLELVEGGGLPTAKLISIDNLKKPAGFPVFGTSEFGHRIRRLRHLNKTEAAVEEIWLDSSYAKKLSASDVSDSLYKFYRENLNLWISRAEDFVGVESPPTWKPDNFASSQSHWGYIERLSYDQSNQPAEYSRTWYDPTTTRFVARWK